MEIVELPSFLREFKHLAKKYQSLHADFAELKLALESYPRGRGEKHWNRLHESESVAIFKTRLICASLRGGNMRIIYAYIKSDTERIELIEIYCKGDKESEDQKRIKDYLARRP